MATTSNSDLLAQIASKYSKERLLAELFYLSDTLDKTKGDLKDAREEIIALKDALRVAERAVKREASRAEEVKKPEPYPPAPSQIPLKKLNITEENLNAVLEEFAQALTQNQCKVQ